MEFDREYILENDRVILTPLNVENAKELEHFSIEEPNLWKYSLLPANGKNNFEKYILDALETRKSKSSYPFLVYDKKMKAYAGSTRFYDFQEKHNTVQLGYTWYGGKFQGTGMNKNCKFLMLQFAFEKLHLSRVEFRADNNNQRSIAAMKSIGCQVEGVLRSNCASSTGRRDSIVLSILDSEWHDSVRQNLMNKITSESQ